MIIFPVSWLFFPLQLFYQTGERNKKALLTFGMEIQLKMSWVWSFLFPNTQNTKVEPFSLHKILQSWGARIKLCIQLSSPFNTFAVGIFLLHIVNYIHIECINRYQCKAFFPREECAMHSCAVSLSWVFRRTQPVCGATFADITRWGDTNCCC